MAQLTTATLALFHRSGRTLEPVETDEPLESGYGPATPPGDNFCNDYTQGLAEAFSTLARARADSVVDDGDLGLVMADRGSPALFGNVVVLRRPLLDDAARRWQHWVAYLDGDPVGTASAWVADHHVHVEFISTLPTARGRGIGAALTLTATRAGGPVPAMLISSDLGRPVYEGLGFRSMLRFTVWAGHRHRPPPEP